MKITRILLLLALGVSALGAPVVRNPLPIKMPAASTRLLASDFNGDGHTDVLAPSPVARKFMLFLGNGTGPFALPQVTELAFEPHEVATGDLNGDGRTDVVAANSAGSFTTFLATSNGQLLNGFPQSTQSGVTGVAIGRFDGDAFADVVFSAGTQLIFLAGNGAGQFASGSTSTFVGPPGDAVPADFNNDGRMDLVAQYGAATAVFLNGGSGTFTISAATTGQHAVAADFNLDGKLDLATVSPATYEEFVEVRTGNGDGTFAAGTRYASGYGPAAITAADVDADGQPDLLISATGCNGVSVLRGNAGGTFDRLELLFTGLVRSVVAADFDRDQKIDIAGVKGDAAPFHIAFVRGNGDGSFDVHRGFHIHDGGSSETRRTYHHAVADMNGDQHPDVVVLPSKLTVPVTANITVLPGDGAGSLGTPLLTDSPAGTFAVGDVTGDGAQDVVVIPQSDSAAVFPGLGNGRFGTSLPFAVTERAFPYLGHFNADSHLDLYMPWGFSGTRLLFGNGSGTFGGAIAAPYVYEPVLLGDLNGDGRIDLPGTINNGDGTFTPVSSPVAGTPAVLADFNGDAKLDLLLPNYKGVHTRFGNGDGTFGAPVPFTFSPIPNYLSHEPATAGDFDGDGKIDVAFGTTIYLSNGDGTFRSRSSFLARVPSLSSADMDGNGTPDLVATTLSGDDVVIMRTQTGADPTRPTTLTLSNDRNGAAQYAQAVTFTANVTGNGIVALTGVVRFTVNAKDVAIIAVDEQGVARYTTQFARGAYDVTATYTGDEHYLSSSASSSLTVTKAAVELSIQGTPNPSATGHPVSITVTRNAPSAPELPEITGGLTFRRGDTPLDLTFENGVAQLTGLPAGAHAISVQYAGDDNYLPASASYLQEVTKALPGLSIHVSPNPTVAWQDVTISAYFTNAVSPSGTVSFLLNGIPFGPVPVTDGMATIKTAFLWGTHTIVASYSGDDTWEKESKSRTIIVAQGQWGTTPVMDARGRPDSVLELRWSAVVGAVSYTLWRKETPAGPWEFMTTTTGYGETSLMHSMPPGVTQLFAVTAHDANGNASPMSQPDPATSFAFTDATLVKRTTRVKAVHLTELRTVIDSIRAFAGLQPFAYTNAIVAGAPVRAVDLLEMRTALAQTRTVFGKSGFSFNDAVPTIIKAEHVNQLRFVVNY